MSTAQVENGTIPSTETKPDERAKARNRSAIAAVVAETVEDGSQGSKAKATPKRTAKVKRAEKPKPRAPKGSAAGRKTGRKPYPVVAFADVLPLAEGIMKYAAGQPLKRTTLLETMGLPETSLSTRNLITNSNKYGVTEGNHSAEYIKLTAKGFNAVNPKANPGDKAKARFDLAIADVEEFALLFEKCKGNALLAPRVLHDVLTGVHEGDRQACVDVFTSNVKFLRMLVPRDGAEYLMTFEEWLGQKPVAPTAAGGSATAAAVDESSTAADGSAIDYDNICFIVSVINDADTPERIHADAMLSQYIEKSLEGTGLKAVRADRIGEQGMISKQVIEHTMKSKLVVADLSFHNPSVFYELALRHVTGKPTVQIMRASEKLPFDVGNQRTIMIDTGDGYTIVREIDTVRSQIATAIRSALANGESRDNPILTYCPTAKFTIDGR